ncbi:UNVERIFIED_CONTAM: hypothetical protein Sradi_0220100 [Sesamum radiatum]|uniref:Myb/SANT-like domain-containing protein n=1 Tax=Sesamum radiatum TaxID=300843 RepID=A0AAW2W4A3_SESRA
MSCSNSRLKAEPHISFKIHAWKKTYECINDMMRRSGFGWNPTTNTIDVKDDAFDNFAKIDSSAKTLWFKLFPYYAKWCEVFEKDRSTGERCFDPILAPRNPSMTVDKRYLMGSSSFTARIHKKWRKMW